ncbi:MAG: FHA domain-containing protein [bacterium]|nr:FHA domain-containing protein [bacterium]
MGLPFSIFFGFFLGWGKGRGDLDRDGYTHLIFSEKKPVYLLGRRSPENFSVDIAVPQQTLDPLHAMFQQEDKGPLQVTDLASKFGIWLKREDRWSRLPPLWPYSLQSGQVLALGWPGDLEFQDSLFLRVESTASPEAWQLKRLVASSFQEEAKIDLSVSLSEESPGISREVLEKQRQASLYEQRGYGSRALKLYREALEMAGQELQSLLKKKSEAAGAAFREVARAQTLLGDFALRRQWYAVSLFHYQAAVLAWDELSLGPGELPLQEWVQLKIFQVGEHLAQRAEREGKPLAAAHYYDLIGRMVPWWGKIRSPAGPWAPEAEAVLALALAAYYYQAMGPAYFGKKDAALQEMLKVPKKTALEPRRYRRTKALVDEIFHQLMLPDTGPEILRGLVRTYAGLP